MLLPGFLCSLMQLKKSANAGLHSGATIKSIALYLQGPSQISHEMNGKMNKHAYVCVLEHTCVYTNGVKINTSMH